MKLAPNEPRCADALAHGCPDRKRCARWVYRLHDMHMSTPFSNFAECRTDRGCRSIIKLETSNANDTE